MKTVPTFWAKVYVGFREGRTENPKPVLHTMDEAQAVVQAFVNEVMGTNNPCGCVTMTPTRYVYGAGWEDGVEIGFINYPRFPGERDEIKQGAMILAERLRKAMGQYRVTVLFPDHTVMLP